MARCSLCLLLSIITAFTHSGTREDGNPLRFFTEEYAPFSFSDNDHVRGINSEILKLMTEKMGLKVEFAVVPWGRAQLATQQNPGTCFFSAARTPDREDIYQWVGPLTQERIILYSLHPDYPELGEFKDASKYRVGGQTNDAYSRWVEAQGVPVDPVTKVADNLDKLKWDRIDLWLAGSIAGPYIASQGGLDIYAQAASDEVFELWLACSLDLPDYLIRELNRTLQNFETDGTLKEIRGRYN